MMVSKIKPFTQEMADRIDELVGDMDCDIDEPIEGESCIRPLTAAERVEMERQNRELHEEFDELFKDREPKFKFRDR